MKKIVSLVLALLMVFSVAASLAELEITTEEITLTYVSKEDPELVQRLANQFMQAYPNIKVEILELDIWTYMTGLGNLAAEKNLPDVFWVDGVQDPVANDWALRLDDLYAADPDAQRIMGSILDGSKIGGRRYSIPVRSQPYVMAINKTLFDKYNVELPDYDWTWEEFVSLAEEVAHPEVYDFGYGDCGGAGYFIEEWGWDGESYTFDDTWVMMEEHWYDWMERKIQENMTPEERETAFGDSSALAFGTGHAAMNVYSSHFVGALLDGSLEQTLGCEFLFYPVPTPRGTQNSIVDFACISKATKYPNEAWLLAKWMDWGREATLLRNEYFAEVMQDTGAISLRVPILTDEDLWVDTRANTSPRLDNFLENLPPLLPYMGAHAPGHINCMINYAFGGVGNSILSGEKKPADLAAELRQKYNGYRDNWFASCAEFATATDLDIATVSDAE
ncbi:MAG: extracellular solute-binding protein [Clostridiales bacterium]|nr:extracellular solute-binding protein [Clostridiales bacterium]